MCFDQIHAFFYWKFFGKVVKFDGQKDPKSLAPSNKLWALVVVLMQKKHTCFVCVCSLNMLSSWFRFHTLITCVFRNEFSREFLSKPVVGWGPQKYHRSLFHTTLQTFRTLPKESGFLLSLFFLRAQKKDKKTCDVQLHETYSGQNKKDIRSNTTAVDPKMLTKKETYC